MMIVIAHQSTITSIDVSQIPRKRGEIDLNDESRPEI